MTPIEQAAVAVGWQRTYLGQIAGDGPPQHRWQDPERPLMGFQWSRPTPTADQLLRWLQDEHQAAVMLVTVSGAGGVVATALAGPHSVRAVAPTCVDALARLVVDLLDRMGTGQ